MVINEGLVPQVGDWQMAVSDLNNIDLMLDLAIDTELVKLVSDAESSWLWCAENSRIVWANPSALEFWAAASIADLAARTQSTSVHGNRQLNAIAKILHAGTNSLERLRFYRHGREILLTCRVSLKRIAASNFILVQTLGQRGTKISDEVRLESIAASLPEAALIIRTDGSIASLNDAARKCGFGAPKLDEKTGAQLAEIATTGDVDASHRLHHDTLDGSAIFNVTIRRLAIADRKDEFYIAVLSPTKEAPADSMSPESLMTEDQDQTRAAALTPDMTENPIASGEEAATPTNAPTYTEPKDKSSVVEDETSNDQDDIEIPEKEISGAAALVAAVNNAFGTQNIVPIRGGDDFAFDPTPPLDENEQNAFQAIADALGARLESHEPQSTSMTSSQSAGATTSPSNDEKSNPVTNGRQNLQLGLLPDETEFATLLARLPLGIFVYRGNDSQGTGDPLFANRAFLNLFGYGSIENIKGAGGVAAILPKAGVISKKDKSFTQTSDLSSDIAIVGEESSPIHSNRENNNQGRESGQVEMFIHDSSGVRIAVKARLQAVKWDRQNAMMLTLQKAGAPAPGQITNLEPASGSNQFQSILDHVLDAFLILDIDGTVKSINQGAKQLFASQDADIVGKSFSRLLREPSNHQAEILFASTRDNLSSAGFDDGCDVVARNVGDEDKSLFLKIHPIESAGNSLFCAVFNDISRWKNAQKEQTDTPQNTRSNDEQKTTFLAKISHEIRTPLNSILGFSDAILEEEFGPLENKHYREYITNIKESGAHLLTLVNDLLDLSKVEAGKMVLDFTNADLNEIAASCIKSMQPQANKARIIIRSNLAPNLAEVVADKRSLRQICLNLLSNSVKFTGPGGQVIVATRLTETGEIELRIHDTGTGMDNRELEAAMKPFRQLDNGFSDTPGTGLGLPLTKALVEENRARFDIESNKGQGTLVKITFPVNRVLAD